MVVSKGFSGLEAKVLGLAGGALLLAPVKANTFPVVRLFDVSEAERLVNWSDTTSVLQYPLVLDSTDFLAMFIDAASGETLSVDTISQYTNVSEEKAVIPDEFGFKAVNGVLELPIPTNAPGVLSLNVYNVAGRSVKSVVESVNPGSYKLGFEGLPSDVYLVSADLDGFKTKAKVLVVDGRVVGVYNVDNRESVESGGVVRPVLFKPFNPSGLDGKVLVNASLQDSVWLLVRELYDTLSPPTPGDTSQHCIGDWYDFKAKLPYSVLDLDTVDVLMIPFEELTAADSLGRPYFPGGVLHGMKRLTETDMYSTILKRWGDNINVNGRRSSVPIKVVTIVSRPDGTPALDSLPGGDWTTEFWNLIRMLNDSVPKHVLPVIVVPFDSSMVYPPLPETLPYQNLTMAPDTVYNVAIYHFGVSGQTGSTDPGWTHMYSLSYPVPGGSLPVRCGAWMKIRTDLNHGTSIPRVLAREFGRGIGLYARGPPIYAMHENPGVKSFPSFHHDEFLILGLDYGLTLFAVMKHYLTNN
ncbi:hypothetical protein J7L02_01145 [Candidatus Woesearchaeota archaeon]|nr:hypothetical protein [Candidatus Woesearchaeota archaeon]